MSRGAAIADRAWYGRDLAARAARVSLTPAASIFGAIATMRGRLYDAGLLRVEPLALPAISVGNLSVGGTGKTPVAAWIAHQLIERGAHPAVILRGYGGDEPLVHRFLNPDAPVVADRDRVSAVAAAAALGADVAVLDDAFQHRRAKRDIDIVLLSADRWTGRVRSLPAGPWREPLVALRRASLVIVTRKAADTAACDAVVEAAAAAAPNVPVAIVHLAANGVRSNAGDETALASLRAKRVLAVSAIGDPRAFHAQIASIGALVEPATFGDHHAFTAAEAASIAARAADLDAVVCTLKDAVKLWPLWPRGAPTLWYVSQRLTVERGADVLDAMLDRLVPKGGPGRP